jgi:choline dehydrogenase
LFGFNSGSLSGGAYTTETIDPDSATRSSAQTSYLTWALQNTQLKVYNRTLASKVLFTAGKATGVTVSTDGAPAYTLTATKEVILSAGAFHSPQLLMLSGIGPQALLNSLSIPVISALPGVGQNLQDPIFFSVQSGVKTPSLASELADPNRLVPNLASYTNNKAGPYSSAGGYIAFEKLPAASRSGFSARTKSLLASLPDDVPEIEYLAGSFAGTGGGVTTVGDLSAAVLNPFSRGSVTLSSANITDWPIINMGWLTDAADAEVAVAAFKRLRQAWSSPLLGSWKVGPEVTPGASVQTDAQILTHIRNNAIQIWHASATNAMGTSPADGAVVDWRAKVFGVDGLRVVDASALPFALPGHPQATIYAFAEKIAASILEGN